MLVLAMQFSRSTRKALTKTAGLLDAGDGQVQVNTPPAPARHQLGHEQ